MDEVDKNKIDSQYISSYESSYILGSGHGLQNLAFVKTLQQEGAKFGLHNGYEDGYVNGQEEFSNLNEKTKFIQGFNRGLARGSTAAEKRNDFTVSSNKALITKLGTQYEEGFKIGFTKGYSDKMVEQSPGDLEYYKLRVHTHF